MINGLKTFVMKSVVQWEHTLGVQIKEQRASKKASEGRVNKENALTQ